MGYYPVSSGVKAALPGHITKELSVRQGVGAMTRGAVGMLLVLCQARPDLPSENNRVVEVDHEAGGDWAVEE